MIIHLQDAHCNYSGQENLAHTLDFLMNKYKVSLVLVEGSSMDATLTALREALPKAMIVSIAAVSPEEYDEVHTRHMERARPRMDPS